MTGYTVHTGSNDKFREGWDNIFGGKERKIKQKKSASKQLSAAKSKKKGKAKKKSGNKS